jgi:hypothetical protein
MVVNMDVGIINAVNQPILNPLTYSWLGRTDAPVIFGQVGNFNRQQTQILLAQLAYSASLWNTKLYNNQNYTAGKYQVNSLVLANYGYINTQFFNIHGANSLSYATSWTGQDGIGDLLQFLTNSGIQDRLAFNYMSDNYNALVDAGAVTDNDTLDVQAGMLFVAHLLGPAGAFAWRTSGATSATPGGYYNAGRYAITVLA